MFISFGREEISGRVEVVMMIHDVPSIAEEGEREGEAGGDGWMDSIADRIREDSMWGIEFIERKRESSRRVREMRRHGDDSVFDGFIENKRKGGDGNNGQI